MIINYIVNKRHRILGIASAISMATVLCSSLINVAEAAKRKGAEPVYSPPAAAMVVDVNTGRALFAENADAPRIPASITKVMTLYLLFEQIESGHFRLDTPLRVTKYAASQPPSKLGVRPGSTIIVEDAIKALITRSANDVAVVIAENIAGTEAKFARMMTQKARAIGMAKSTFRNPHGLPADPPNITTARDLTTLGLAIQDRFPQYYAYFSTRSFNYAGKFIGNHNRLLGRVEGVDGIKTGYTRASGFNLLTSMRAGNRHVIATVLGGRTGASRDQRMESLLARTLPNASSGRRSAPLVAEAPSARKLSRPVTVAQLIEENDTTSAIMSMPVGKPISLSNIRPVAASASGVSAPSALPPSKPSAASALAYAETPAPRPANVANLQSAPSTEEADSSASASKWVIQLGASPDESKANHLLQQARRKYLGLLANASPFTEKVVRGNVILFRARFSGFDPERAQKVCKTLKSNGFDCFATRG